MHERPGLLRSYFRLAGGGGGGGGRDPVIGGLTFPFTPPCGPLVGTGRGGGGLGSFCGIVALLYGFEKFHHFHLLRCNEN
jgi:hypothetical protein